MDCSDKFLRKCYVVLGQACNFNCLYCIEGHSHNSKLNNDIDESVFEYIKDFVGVVVFYGGEPLLYWDAIKTIVLRFPHKHYSIMTNGSLVSTEHIEFVNRYKISVNVSWDGRSSSLSRGYDVVEKNWNNLRLINKLWISSVINKYNYPLQLMEDVNELDQEYLSLHGYHLNLFIEPVIKNYEGEVFDVDCKRLTREIVEILNLPRLYIHYYFKDYILRYLFPNSFKPRCFLKCGFGINHSAINLKGDMLMCKNDTSVMCSVAKKEKYKEYVLAADKHIAEGCLKCSISGICRGGCRINGFQEHFCKLQKAFYEPIIRLLR